MESLRLRPDRGTNRDEVVPDIDTPCYLNGRWRYHGYVVVVVVVVVRYHRWAAGGRCMADGRRCMALDAHPETTLVMDRLSCLNYKYHLSVVRLIRLLIYSPHKLTDRQ